MDSNTVINDSISNAKVIRTSWKNRESPYKSIYFQQDSDSKTESSLTVPRSACVAKGDILEVANGAVYVRCQNGKAQIYPIYSASDVIQFGGLTLPVFIKEITDSEEYRAYRYLTTHHYRGQSLFGRHVPLVMCVSHPLLPSIIGYIELATAFFACKPRRQFFDVACQLDGVSWQRWDLNTARNYISLFVRIARCVVHPELRGTGAGQLLAKHAAQFANTHWQSGGWKPYVLEISADMLRYVPFAEKAGMVYIGDTEGNLHRIIDDISYLIKNRDRLKNKEIFSGDCCGIVDAKLSQFKALLNSYPIDTEVTTEQVLADIKKQTQRATLKGLSKLKDVLIFPKPVYVKGLHPDASKFIENRISELKCKNELNPEPVLASARKKMIHHEQISEPIKTSIQIDSIGVEFTSRVRRTKLTHEVEGAFGISLDTLTEPIFKDLTVSIAPGSLWLVTGVSGTGKSTFLKLLNGELLPQTGHVHIPENAHIRTLEPIRSTKALVEVFGKGNVGRGLELMNTVGLSSAFLYVKSFQHLSAGQKYRAMLAALLEAESNLWLIDAFCENLDPITASLIAEKLSVLARGRSATVVITASDYTRFLEALQPDNILLLQGTTQYRIFTFAEFQTWIEKNKRCQNLVQRKVVE